MNYIPDKDMVQDGIVMRRSAEGVIETNVPWTIVNHSPDGYEWGYAGSGPADFALNIMEAALTRMAFDGTSMKFNSDYIIFSLSAKYYQRFKEVFLANIPNEGGILPWSVVNTWILEKIETQKAKGQREGRRFLEDERT